MNAAGTYLSYWQQPDINIPIDWEALLAGGIQYVHIRASSGLYRDPRFEENVANAEKYGIPWSAWHYLTGDDSGQASFFVNCVGGHAPPMGYIADIEDNALTPEKVARHVGRVDEIIGDKCKVYCSLGKGHLLAQVDPAGRDLWVADWKDGATEPRLPAGWDRWEWWQWHGGMEMPGIPTKALPDVFHGTEEELLAKYGGKEPVDMNMRYYLAGEKVPGSEFYAVFGRGYEPYKAVGDGSNDDFPHILKAQVHELHQIDNMSLRCHLRMLDGSVPDDIDQYEFITWIHGNDYRADFVVVDGKAYAEWVMGNQGWWYNPQDGSAGAGICFIGRKDGELHSEQVRGVGWLSNDTYGTHCHANMVFTIELAEEPPPPTQHYLFYSEEPEGAGYVVVEPEPVNDLLPEDTEVTLTAYANEGWVFSHWSIPVAPEVTTTVKMTQDWAIAAHFEKDTGDIDVAAAIEDGYEALEHNEAVHEALTAIHQAALAAIESNEADRKAIISAMKNLGA